VDASSDEQGGQRHLARIRLVFPAGLLLGRLWCRVAIAAPCSALLVNFVTATGTFNVSQQSGDGSVGELPFVFPAESP
jgi:hypothetical protein